MHAEVAENMGQAVGDMILHHLTNGRELELPFTSLDHLAGHAVSLPELPGFEIGGVRIELALTKHVTMMLLAALLLLLMAWRVRRGAGLVPRGLANVVEMVVLFIRDDIAKGTMGPKAAELYTPYLCTTFFFIVTCNLIGLVPYGSTATGNLGVTATLAFMSFLLIQYAGIRELGVFGYLKHLVPPGVPWWLAPIMFLVELLGVFAKPFALCIRLFANMLAGHVVILSLIGLIFILGWIIAPVTVAFGVFMYVLELFVALLQAYIFTMLTSLFIGLLVAGHHAEEHEEPTHAARH
jgi:F-type H+-transporting ATPase subunit a